MSSMPLDIFLKDEHDKVKKATVQLQVAMNAWARKVEGNCRSCRRGRAHLICCYNTELEEDGKACHPLICPVLYGEE